MAKESIYSDKQYPEYPEFANGPAHKIVSESIEEKRDSITAYTNENLHKRVDNHTPNEDSENHVVEYELGVYGKNSLRSIDVITHYEMNDGSPEAIKSEELEIP